MFTGRLNFVHFCFSVGLASVSASVPLSAAALASSQANIPTITVTAAQEAPNSAVNGFEATQVKLLGSNGSVCLVRFEGQGRFRFSSVMGDRTGLEIACTLEGETYKVTKWNYSRVSIELDTQQRKLIYLDGVLKSAEGGAANITAPFPVSW